MVIGVAGEGRADGRSRVREKDGERVWMRRERESWNEMDGLADGGEETRGLSRKGRVGDEKGRRH
jgi:hypothetical protein